MMRISGVRMPTDLVTWRNFVFQSNLNSVVPFTFIAWAEQTIDAGLATILNSTAPIFVFLITLGFTRHEPVTSRKLFGVIAGLAGVVLIVGMQALDGMGRDFWAELGIFAATLCYAGAAVFGRNFAGHNPMIPAAGSMICGAAVLLPASLVVEHPWTLTPSWRSVIALLGLAILSTALAFIIYFRLLRTLGSVGTTAQAYLRVPIGVLIGVIFLGEQPSPTAWVGLLCVVAGVAAMTIPSGK
jgi:drug/metabolite transporter (DMT)-like permease